MVPTPTQNQGEGHLYGRHHITLPGSNPDQHRFQSSNALSCLGILLRRLLRAEEISTAYSQDTESNGWKTVAIGTEVYQTTPSPVLTKLEGQENKRTPEQRESFHFIHLLTRKTIKNNLSKESRLFSPISEARAGLPIPTLIKDLLSL